MIVQRISIAFLACMTGFAPLVGAALAQNAPPTAASSPHPFRDKFEAANTTHDGHLTLAQAQAGNMPMVAQKFSAIDADHKGYVTLQDVHQFMKARRAARQAPAPSGPPS